MPIAPNSTSFAKELDIKELQIPFLITTSNLILRALKHQDVKAVHIAVNASLKELRMWLPWMDYPPNDVDSLKLTLSFFQEEEENLARHFVVYNNEHFIGMISLYNASEALALKLGYWFRTYRESVYPMELFEEALIAVMQLCFEQLSANRLIIPCISGNFFNEILAKKLDFTLSEVKFVDNKCVKKYELHIYDSKRRIPTQIVFKDENT